MVTRQTLPVLGPTAAGPVLVDTCVKLPLESSRDADPGLLRRKRPFRYA